MLTSHINPPDNTDFQHRSAHQMLQTHTHTHKHTSGGALTPAAEV